MTSPTSPTYNIISPREPICDKHGIITPAWWRFFQSTFMALGGYQPGPGGPTQPINLTTLYNLAFSEFGRTGPDYEHQIGDVRTDLSSRPNSAGRIAALEARVQQLETLLANAIQPRADLVNLQREADATRALTMGVHSH